MSILSNAHFHNEEAAYAYVEERLWPEGPICPKCGVIGNSAKLQGKSTRIGVYKCQDCRKPFRVTVGTIFEASHIPLNVWLQAIYLIASSKKGFSSNQLHRSLGITLKSAWFMSHRIREAMKGNTLEAFGIDGGFVEVDETFIGQDATRDADRPKARAGYGHKQKVLSLIDRKSGKSRSMVVDNLKVKTLLPLLQANIAPQATLMTDEAVQYFYMGKKFAMHQHVQHNIGEYVFRYDKEIHNNSVEGFFSIFKRGMKGVYQHCGHNHLQRYLAEYDFRYSNRAKLGIDDVERANILLQGVKGKRLTYRATAS